MSISPPSDIVLDVARAADPVSYREAVAKLTAARPAAGFSDTMSDVAMKEPPPAPRMAAAAAETPKPKSAADFKAEQRTETFRSFEAMALATMLQSAMTSGSESYFGKGIAGDTWKSLMVEQIATQMAKHGGVGIADTLSKSAALAMADASTAAPDAARTLLTSSGERALLRALDTDGGDTTG